jgi:hypothetical protein
MTPLQNLSFSVLLFGALQCLYCWKLRRQRRLSTQTALR